jgi:hypothetical protein
MIINSLKKFRNIPSVDEIRDNLNIPWLRLIIDVPYTEIYREFINLDIPPVEHRSDDVVAGAKNKGWKSLTLHGIDSHITEEGNGKHSWTEVAKQCPITVDWIKHNFIIDENTGRIRFMLIEPGGYILPHHDRNTKGLREINVAIKQPKNCIFKFIERGIVPFKDGSVFLLDTSNTHMVYNDSDQPRLHMILHTNVNDKVIETSYEKEYYRYNYDYTGRKAIIIHDCDNDSLLRFTQTKLFFDAKNNGLEFFDECITVGSYEEAHAIATKNESILYTGQFLTTTYREAHRDQEFAHDVSLCKNTPGHEECVIEFDQNKPIDFKKRYYHHPSKQCYIIENMLRTIIHSDKYIYIDNTDLIEDIGPKYNRFYPGPYEEFDYSLSFNSMKHFYGLASGFKSMKHVIQHDYESITIFDRNQYQLDFAKLLHSYTELPNKLPEKIDINKCIGTWNPSEFVKDNWSKWHDMDVKFELIDLFDIPRFKSDSVVWCSNVFFYEPMMFLYGYETVVNKLKELTEVNYDCIIVTDG